MHKHNSDIEGGGCVADKDQQDRVEAPEWPEQMEEQAEKTNGGAPQKRHVFDSGCAKCGALLPAGSEICLICGTARDEMPYAGAFPVPPVGEEPPRPVAPDQNEIRAARATPDRWRRWVGAVSGVMVLLLVALGGLSIYQQYFDTGSFRADEAAVYSQGGVLMLTHPGLEQPLAVTGAAANVGADFSQGMAVPGPSGRWMACADNAGGLYRIDLAQSGADSVLVAPDYSHSAVFSEDSEFLLYVNELGELYASNLSDRWRLDTGVAEILDVSNHRVLYTRRGDREGQADLYLNDLRQNGGEMLVIDRDIAEVLDWTGGFERILYTTWQPGEDGPQTASLHRFELGEAGKSTTTTLVTEVGKVLDASAERGVAVYLTPRQQRWGYEQFIDDDMAAADAALREPDLADYPLVGQVFALYGESADFSDLTENEELVEQLNTWRELEQGWEDKQTRDALRAQLREVFAGLEDPVELGDLYVYAGGSLSMLDSGVWDTGELTPQMGRVSAVDGYIAYEKLHADTLRKISMSELWQDTGEAVPNPVSYFLEGTRRELLFARLDGAPVQIYVRSESGIFKQWWVAAGGTGVYFVAGREQVDASGDTLFYTSLTGTDSADPKQVERDVSALESGFRDGVLFWTASGEDARLNLAQGATANQLSSGDTSPVTLENGGNTLLFIERRDSVGGTGDVYMLAGELTLVAGAVADYRYRTDDLVYLLRPGTDSTVWDLYVWQGGREGLLGRDVQILSSEAAKQAM